jgi:hypothetical protein
MGLLDKLKPQPRWKHADPAIRLEAVRELDDPIELGALAETDADARVRRAAVVKIADPAVLGRVAAHDADADARERAADRLQALAGSRDDEAAALAAVRQIADARRLSTIAKSDAAEAVASDALSRTTDERALSSIARTAKQETIARAALERLTSTDELIDAAEHAEHKDVAVAAFERLAPTADLALLRTIESRTQQKSVAKRAKTIIQGIEEAEAARIAAEEDRKRQQTSLIEQVEHLAHATDTGRGRADLARLTDAWHALVVTDTDASSRFARGVSLADTAMTERERQAAEAAELARQRAETQATLEALCARVETLDGEDALEQLTPIEEEWRSLLPLLGSGPEADRLAERFAQAVTACRKRHDLRASLTATRSSLETLVAEAEGLPSLEDESAASARWHTLGREARGLTATLQDAGRPAADLDERLAAVGAAFADRESARDAARRDALAQAQQELAANITRLGERARRASEAESVTLREGDRLMRDINTGLEGVGRIESSKDIEEAVGRLRGFQEKVAPRVRELREMDDWRRFANAQRQEQLIAMAEAIVLSLKNDETAGTTSDLAATARALRELHAKWQEVAEAPRQSAQRLWDRFRTATDFIRSRCESYFSKMREERVESLQKKTVLVEEAEALANSNDWGRAAGRLRELQTAWQESGAVPRDAGRDLAVRFRAACNAFFSRRREDLTDRKKTWAENLAKKEALCERSETLAESTEWESASADMKRLQAEWKTIGPVRRNKSEVVWQRFRAAADKFFERYHNRHQIALASKLVEREQLVMDLEKVAGTEGDAPATLVADLQQLRSTWNRSVPLPTAEMKVLADRWQAAFSSVITRWPDAFAGTDLDPAAAKQRLEKLIVKVEALLVDSEQPKGQSQAEILAARLRSALASNAMGGRASDETKWRAAADAVRDAQSAWLRLSPLAGQDAEALEPRFREACRRVNDLARRHAPSHSSGPRRENRDARPPRPPREDRGPRERRDRDREREPQVV